MNTDSSAQSNGTDSSTPGAGGHTYGDIFISGQNARLLLGDNYATHVDLFETGTPQQRRDMLLNLLHYDGLGLKRDQLAMVTASTKSFDWIENTPFPAWLNDASSHSFWILGKPGSGKSTLMKHLADSRSTLDRLKGSDRKDDVWSIVHFFFDYRAARATANSILGMLKQFVRQLVTDTPAIDAYVQRRYSDIQDAGLDLYIDILAKGIIEAKINVCAFIDGLDEYEDNLVDLCSTLENLQNRTGMKMCFASRPEEPFEAALARLECPSIIVQEHNLEAIAACVENKVARLVGTSTTLRDLFTPKLQQSIVSKAEGVILWASLVVDELFRSCQDDSVSVRCDLGSIVDSLPSGLNPLYKRILSKSPPQHRGEIALLLELITDYEANCPSTLTLELLWQAAYYLRTRFTHAQIAPPSDPRFCASRLRALLGNMVELIKTNPHFTSSKPAEISPRIFHKSFSAYLGREQWTKFHLDENLRQAFPDSIWKRLSIDFMKETEEHLIVQAPSLVNARNSLGTPVWTYYRKAPFSLTKRCCLELSRWDSCGKLLEIIIADFNDMQHDSATMHKDICFPCVRKYALACTALRLQRSSSALGFVWMRILRLHEHGALDLAGRFLCVSYPDREYLSRRISALDQTCVNDLLDFGIFAVSSDILRESIQLQAVKEFVQLLVLYGGRLAGRHVCQLHFTSKYRFVLHELCDTIQKEQPGHFSYQHDLDCPYWNSNMPLIIHWVHGPNYMSPIWVKLFNDMLAIGLILDHPTDENRNLLFQTLNEVHEGRLMPDVAERKLLDASEFGPRSAGIDLALNFARSLLASVRSARRTQSIWSQLKVKMRAKHAAEAIRLEVEMRFYESAIKILEGLRVKAA